MKPRRARRPRRDERVLVSFLRDVAENPIERAPVILDARARASAWGMSWPEMYATLPRFPDNLNFGSPNMRSLAQSLGLYHPATTDEAMLSWVTAQRLDMSAGFEHEEPGSRIYGTWTLLGHLLAYRKHPSDYFARWLRLWWTVRRLSMIELPDGPMSLRCGARSQGIYNRTKADYADGIAFGISWKWRRKPHPFPDASWAKSNEITAFNALSREIQSSSEGIATASVSDLVATAPRWPTIAPTVYRRTTEGLAVWCERSDANANTPGIAAMMVNWMNFVPFLTWTPNGIWAAPISSRAHIRQKKVPQEISRAGNTLHFRQLSPGYPQEFDLALPGGGLIYEVLHGADGLEMVG